MRDECRRCHTEFGPDCMPDLEYPHLCEDCVDAAKDEMEQASQRLEDQSLDADIWVRCPEM